MIVVTGVSGAGKSTLCARAQERLGPEYQVVNFGTTMERLARDQGIADGITALRQESMDTYRRIMLDACDAVAARQSHSIVDTRCLVTSNRGYLPGMPAEILMNLAPSRIILIEGEPSEILSRRRLVKGKPWYGRQAQEEVVLQQSLARHYAVAGSFATGAPLALITNRDGEMEEALEQLVQAITDQSWEIRH